MHPVQAAASGKSTGIHPTAVVDPAARIGDGVSIGPYAVIGPEVEIGAGCQIGPHVVIDGRVRMGEGNRVFPGACIGLEPQDFKYAGDPTEVVIGDNNIIRECVTIHRASGRGTSTDIGSENMFMAYSHVGHNCKFGNKIVVTNTVAIAGHVVVGDRAVIGGVLGIHQFVHIGSMAMVGGMSRIDRDVPPFMIVEGHPGRLRGLNLIGIRRSGLADLEGGAQLRQLQDLWSLLYRSDRVLSEALRMTQSLELLEAGQQLVTFLELSIGPGRRGPLPPQR
ncbi:MAG: acyl-ACP--UDP-N-acetylglucosamine O-acyltransferase [Cyanobacteriota bacterium]|nr:acyl-ACP--UDP-N-acetylglucosamine O-acyltransferase [Cyanobacteriota bacterium]